jgi:hypothetical protein
MIQKETGGPAFPNEGFNGWGKPQEGMTLRDYFAARASEDDIRAQGEWIRAEVQTQYGHGVLPEGWRTKARYMHADEMLKARAS